MRFDASQKQWVKINFEERFPPDLKRMIAIRKELESARLVSLGAIVFCTLVPLPFLPSDV